MQHKRPVSLIIIVLLVLTTARQIGLLDSNLIGAEAAALNSSDGQTRMSQIEALLGQSPIGVNALTMMNQYRVKVRFSQGGGTHYRAQTNTVQIDLGHEPLRAALAFVHEMNHARYHHEGLAADVRALSREDYVLAKLQEEAESIALSIETRMELAQAGFDVSAVGYPLDDEYAAALHSLGANVPGLSDDDVAQLGQRAARKLVYDALADGVVRGSSEGQTYPDKFGRRWDQANALPTLLNEVGQVISQQS